MPIKRPAGIFVLGMHRSGTSAAILSLESLGLHLCVDSDRLREGRGNSNPDHGESLSVIAENDALLDLYNGSWLLPQLDGDWLMSEQVISRRAAAKAAFDTAHPDHPWACKDPRLCLTLPFWDQALGARHPVLLVLRHPLEIVKSLQKRETEDDPRQPASYYLALWERYLRSALRNAARHPVYVLKYSDLIEDWDGTITKLRKWLACHNLPIGEPTTRPINPNLRHARSGASLAGLTPDQRRLHQLSLSLAGPHRRLRVPKLGRETPRTAALFGPSPALATAGFLTLPADSSLRQRFAQVNPLESRRYFMLGAIATMPLMAASVALMQLARLGHPTAVDGWITKHLIQSHLSAFDNLLRLFSALSTRTYLDAVATMVVILLLLWRKHSAAASMMLGLLATEIVTDLLSGQSHNPAGFFGGHAFRAAVILSLIGYLSLRLIKLPWLQRAIAVSCFTLVGLVAISRVYVQAHYPSAVLASLLLGAAIAVLLAALFEAVQKSPHRLPAPRHAAATKLIPTTTLDDIS